MIERAAMGADGDKNLADSEISVRGLVLDPERKAGMLLGVAIGDRLGLPVETLTAAEIEKRFGRITTYHPLKLNKFFAGATPLFPWSDDTQLTLCIEEALKGQKELNLDRIAEEHIKAYNQTTAGWGKSTLVAIERLKNGAHWSISGKGEGSNTACGNGVAMKVAPIATFLIEKRIELVQILPKLAALTAMTHPTSMAVSSAFAQVAAVLYCLSNTKESFSASEFLAEVVSYSMMGLEHFPETQGKDDLSKALRMIPINKEFKPEEIIKLFGGGGSYVFQSLPFSYAFFLQNPFSVESLYAVINSGGDTDSNGSMVGALLGALNGPKVFPEHLTKS